MGYINSGGSLFEDMGIGKPEPHQYFPEATTAKKQFNTPRKNIELTMLSFKKAGVLANGKMRQRTTVV